MSHPSRLAFTVPGEPQPTARHRTVVRGGRVISYTPRQTVAAKEAVQWAYRAARGPGRGPDGSSAFSVEMTFHVATRRRRDVDNLAKLVLDALTGLAWTDDSQVTDLCAHIRHGAEAPRSEIVITTAPERAVEAM